MFVSTAGNPYSNRERSLLRCACDLGSVRVLFSVFNFFFFGGKVQSPVAICEHWPAMLLWLDQKQEWKFICYAITFLLFYIKTIFILFFYVVMCATRPMRIIWIGITVWTNLHLMWISDWLWGFVLVHILTA